MSPLLIKISKDFATLWTTIDPIGNVALFAGLTAALTRKERHLTALRAVIYATIILVAAGTVGQVIETRSLPTLTRSYPRRFTFYVAEPLSSILDAIGIHMHSLKVAGGIILFLFGVQMLFGKMDSKTDRTPEEGRDLAVFPLAVPSIAGPGAMMAVIVLTDNDVYTVPERLETGVVLVVVLFITYMLLLFSDGILRVIGRQGASVLVRVMGLILCSLAVEIVLTALGVGGWTTVPK
jgi:multiple antibiotic resistance protein